MHINRSNYEQYFLLYADNELSVSDKESVEAFVRENIDLKDDFLITQLTVSSPDEAIKLRDKSFLLKKESAFITENNYEEIFILYYDGELTDEQKKETELFAERNIKFKKKFELIGKAKLIANDSVAYPQKKQLYRRERHSFLIQPIWTKITAAAILIGFVLWVSVSYFNKSNINSHLSTLGDNHINQPVMTGPMQNDIINANNNREKVDSASAIANDIQKLNKNETGIKKAGFNKSSPKDELIAIKKEKTKNEIVKPELIEDISYANLQLATTEKITKKLPPLIVTENALRYAQVMVQQNENRPESHNLPFVQVGFNAPDNNSQDYVFYDISVEDFRKSKVGEIFKKVKRVVERNNPLTRLLAKNGE